MKFFFFLEKIPFNGSQVIFGLDAKLYKSINSKKKKKARAVASVRRLTRKLLTAAQGHDSIPTMLPFLLCCAAFGGAVAVDVGYVPRPTNLSCSGELGPIIGESSCVHTSG